jgi:hypothetical protein
MLICKDIKTVFIAVPKTGTRSIYKILKEKFNTISLNDHLINVPVKYKDYFTFIVKRNPYDRFVSTWWSSTNRFVIKRNKIKHLIGNDKSINRFCKIFPQLYNTEKLFKCQSIYYENNKIDKILEFDNLEEEFLKLNFIKDNNIKSIPSINVTYCNKKDDEKPRNYRKHWSHYINNDIKKIILKYYEKDFELLKYNK